MIVPDYYYIIVGGGLAGLQLALRIKDDVFFKGKKIAIIEPSEKETNDKTWCFWERSPGRYNHLVSKSWNKGEFYSTGVQHKFDLEEYSYKKIRSLDFYSYAYEQLQKADEFTFIKDNISKIDEVTRTAVGKKANYTATHFFDSRPPENYKEDSNYTLIHQHFKGWEIETDEPVFDPEVFTMMDFRFRYRDTTSFTYILPQTPHKALIEFTFFSPELVEERVYDKMLEKYLREILRIRDWEVIETEKGIIPMTDYPFHKHNSTHVTKIGTGGGWVKASSGYSFKNTERKTEAIIENIKYGYPTYEGLINKKFQKFDAIFLDVLAKRNDLGEELFSKFYTKNSIEDIFRFLDEETSLSEDIKIMLSIYHPQFIRSFFNKL